MFTVTMLPAQVYLVTCSAANSANPEQVFKSEIFQGDFLETQSVIYLKVWYPYSPIPGRRPFTVFFSQSGHFSSLLSVPTISPLSL
jgi:hypothetical protein